MSQALICSYSSSLPANCIKPNYSLGLPLTDSSIIIIINNEYPEAGLTASISVQHIYYKHELQQKNFTNTIITL